VETKPLAIETRMIYAVTEAGKITPNPSAEGIIMNAGKKKYYYITDVESVPLIQEQGITADEGAIPIFIVHRGKMRDVLNTAGYIAANQLFLGEYALFEIMEAGITGDIISHGVSGKTAPFQKIITQESIARDYIKFINCFTTTFSV